MIHGPQSLSGRNGGLFAVSRARFCIQRTPVPRIDLEQKNSTVEIRSLVGDMHEGYSLRQVLLPWQ